VPEGATRFRNRETGALETERVFGGGALEFLYGTARGRWLTNHVLVRGATNRLYGWLQRAPGSRGRIRRFVDELGIDASEAELPLERYKTLDEFFMRRLRPGARPIDATPGTLVSPADGRTLVFPKLEGTKLPVKGSQVTLETLVGDAGLAASFVGGAAVIVRLAPADYHRFHFPESGFAWAERRVAGPLHSVHPIALASGAPSFANKRSVTRLETAAFGELALVEVGALCVGTIIQTYHPGHVARGQEKGFFRFGGSTVVLLAQAGRLELDRDLVEASAEGVETFVRMGTRIGRRVS
jgi:phosphatidylserine decarboxylase